MDGRLHGMAGPRGSRPTYNDFRQTVGRQRGLPGAVVRAQAGMRTRIAPCWQRRSPWRSSALHCSPPYASGRPCARPAGRGAALRKPCYSPRRNGARRAVTSSAIAFFTTVEMPELSRRAAVAAREMVGGLQSESRLCTSHTTRATHRPSVFLFCFLFFFAKRSGRARAPGTASAAVGIRYTETARRRMAEGQRARDRLRRRAQSCGAGCRADQRDVGIPATGTVSAGSSRPGVPRGRPS